MLVNPLHELGWDLLLQTSDQTTFFHTSAWARVLSESYGYTPLYFIAIDEGRLTGLIPVMEIKSFLTGKRGVSLPFTDTCQPLAKDQETFDLLLEELVTHGRMSDWDFIEIRGEGNFLQNEPIFKEYIVHTLELRADETQVNQNFRPNFRRNIRKAENTGVKVTVDRSCEAIAAFYKLHCGTRQRHGLLPQPWYFFKKIYEHVIETGKGLVALATYQNQWIAGAVFTLYRDQAMFKYGASDRKSQYMRPNNLIMWEVIRWLIRNGFRSVHLGRTEPGNDGLIQFKRGWGANECKVAYYRFNIKKEVFISKPNSIKSSYFVFKFLPIPVLKFAGKLIYRHVG